MQLTRTQQLARPKNFRRRHQRPSRLLVWGEQAILGIAGLTIIVAVAYAVLVAVLLTEVR